MAVPTSNHELFEPVAVTLERRTLDALAKYHRPRDTYFASAGSGADAVGEAERSYFNAAEQVASALSLDLFGTSTHPKSPRNPCKPTDEHDQPAVLDLTHINGTF